VTVVDSHTHVWINDPQFPWPHGQAAPFPEDRTAEMLLQLMAANGVDKTVIVHPIHYLWDNRYAIHSAIKYPDKFMAAGRVNPEDPEAPDHLSEWTEQGLHGVRLSPAGGTPGDWFAGPLMDPLFTRAQQLGVPLLLLTTPPRLDDLVPLLDRHPDLDVVIDHMAHAHVPGAGSASAGSATIDRLLDLARYPRVYVKISHTWSVSSEPYPWKDTHAAVDQTYQAFGPRRIMWGTDWPVCLSDTEYDKPLPSVRDEMRFIADEDMEWVLGKTALQLWPFDSCGG
jgi:L-fuconolactonase